MIGIDTSVLVRYFTGDDVAQAALARRLVEQTLSAQQPGHVSLVALAELVWVLRRRYAASRDEVSLAIETLMTTPALRVQDEDAVWRAVDEYDAGGVEFADALIASVDRCHGCHQTMTFDRKASRLGVMTLLQAQ